jgi:peroxiredoxin
MKPSVNVMKSFAYVPKHPRLLNLKWMAGALLLYAASVFAGSFGVGSPMPAFTLKNVDDQMVSAADYASKPVLVVVVTCNHCPFAKAYESRILSMANSYAAQGVQFVLINPNDPKKQPQDSFENMKARAKEKNYPCPYLWDETQQIAKAYDAARTPEAYVFNKDRKLVYRGRIDDNTEEKQVKTRDLKNALDLVLAGKPDKIENPVTKAFGCTIKWKD